MGKRWLLIALLWGLNGGWAEERWSRFRGEGGTGQADGDPPASWSEWQNVCWKTPLPGRGWSSPVVADGAIWLTTADDDGHSLRALCVDLVSGALLHDVPVFSPETPTFANAVNSYATPSPVVAAGRVYVSFGTMGTACIDAASAQVVWRNTELLLDHKEGPGSSPIVWRDRLILNCDGTDVQYVVALDTATGQIVWRTERSAALLDSRFDLRKAYGTPTVLQAGEHEVLISCGAKRFYAYDPNDGSELWWVDHDGYNTPQAPVQALGNVLLGTGWNHAALMAVELDADATGNITDSHVRWTLTRDVPKMPSPLVFHDRIFLISDDGVATWVDAADGNVLWRRKVLGKMFSSPVAAQGRIYAFDAKGAAAVMSAVDSPELLAENHLASGCMASPALVGNALIVRTTTHLYRIEQR